MSLLGGTLGESAVGAAPLGALNAQLARQSAAEGPLGESALGGFPLGGPTDFRAFHTVQQPAINAFGIGEVALISGSPSDLTRSFVPSATLGSQYACLSEFVLGIVESPDPIASCAGFGTAAATGNVRAVGTATLSGRGSLAAIEGYQALYLQSRRASARYAKPSWPAKIDVGNPLCRGLAMATLCDDRGGSNSSVGLGGGASTSGFNCYNLVGHDHGTLVAANLSTTPTIDTWGAHYAGATSTSNVWEYIFGHSSFLTFANGFSVTFMAKAYGFTDFSNTTFYTIYGVVCLGKIQGSDYTTYDWQLLCTGSTWRLMINTAAGIKDLQANIAGGGVPEIVTATYDGSTMCIYVNGALGASLAVNSALVTNSNCDIYMMGDGGTSPYIGRQRNYDGNVYAAFLHNRAVSAAEAATIARDPYFWFVQKPRRMAVNNPATYYYSGISQVAGRGAITNANATRIVTGTAAIAGHGAITNAAANELYGSGTVAIAGRGTLSASGSRVFGGAATCAGRGAITLASSNEYYGSGTVAIAGRGTLTATGGQIFGGTATCAGRGAITLASGTEYYGSSTATIAGRGTLAASGSHIFGAAATCAGRGAITNASGSEAYGSSTVSIAGRGALAATGNNNFQGIATASGRGAITLAKGTEYYGSSTVTIAGVGRLSATGTASLSGVSTCAGFGTVTASANLIFGSGKAECDGVGTVSVLVSLDAVLVTCIVGNDVPTIIRRRGNYCF